MKFSSAKKAKIKKPKEKAIKSYYNSINIFSYYFPEFIDDDNISDDEDFSFISKRNNNDKYFILLYNTLYHTITIAKLIYTYKVQLHQISQKEILANKDFFNAWIKDVNQNILSKDGSKLTLHNDGSIEYILTDYREESQYLISEQVLMGIY